MRRMLTEAQRRDNFDKIVLMLQQSQTLAHDAGLHASAHAINIAMNKVGFEFAETAPSPSGKRNGCT